MPWLLDTNAWIFYLKNPGHRIHDELAKRDFYLLDSSCRTAPRRNEIRHP